MCCHDESSVDDFADDTVRQRLQILPVHQSWDVKSATAASSGVVSMTHTPATQLPDGQSPALWQPSCDASSLPAAVVRRVVAAAGQ
jgi:hypothetical protein